MNCKVSSLDKIPNGFTGKHIPQSEYRNYKVVGKVPDSVGKVWMHIWQNDSEINWKYTADFDVYGGQSQNGDNSKVDIYLLVS